MRFAAGQAVAVLCSVIRLFGCLGGQLVRPNADIAIEIDPVVERPAAHRQIADLFAEPSATDELELVESELSTCSAAWLAAVAALVLGNNWMVGRTKGLVGRCGTTA